MTIPDTPPLRHVRTVHRARRRIRLISAIASTTLAIGVVDVAAFSSSPVEAATVRYNGAAGAERISVIGDSVMAAIRWYGRWEPLRRYNYTVDVESCRRTIASSCRGREGFAPDNTINAMRRLRGQLGSVLVVGTGYDDPGVTFGSAVDAVMAEAASQGIPVVIWATMRTADVTYVGPTYASNASTFRDNNRILLAKAAQYGGRLQIADWATYSASHGEWVERDGIHLTPSGATAMAQFIANQAAAALLGISVITGLMAWAAPAKGVGSGQVLLGWSPPTHTGGRPVTDYRIQRSSDGGTTWQTFADGVSPSRSYLASGLTNRHAYRFRVAAYTSAGWGPYSAAVTAAPRVALPSTPTGLISFVAPTGGVGSGQVLLGWNLPTYTGGRAVTDYTIQRSSDGGATWRPFGDGVSPSRSYLASGLTNGHTYLFRVAAYTSAGWSRYSAAVTAAPGDQAALAATALTSPTTTGATTTTTTASPTTASPTTVSPTTVSPTVPGAPVGDLVWADADGDGVQDVGELGVEGVVVRLIGDGDTVLVEDVTDWQGRYELAPPSSGSFLLEVVLPDGFEPTLVDIGSDDAIDSDVDRADVQVGPVETTVRVAFDYNGDEDLDHDVGLVPVPEEPLATTSTTTEPPAPPTSAETTSVPTTLAPTTVPPTTTTAPTTEPITVATTAATTTTQAITTTSAPAG